jgi:hypothetical protein
MNNLGFIQTTTDRQLTSNDVRDGIVPEMVLKFVWVELCRTNTLSIRVTLKCWWWQYSWIIPEIIRLIAAAVKLTKFTYIRAVARLGPCTGPKDSNRNGFAGRVLKLCHSII